MKKYLSPANIITVAGGALAFIGMTAYFTDSVNLSVPTFFYGVPILLIGLGLKTSEIPPVKLVNKNDFRTDRFNRPKELTELATDWSYRYGVLPKSVESLIQVMKLKLLSKSCGFSRIKLKKPNIIIETRIKATTFKLIKKSLPSNVQDKFYFVEDDQFSKITIRGLGITDIQNQFDQLIYWFGLFDNEIKNFSKNPIK